MKFSAFNSPDDSTKQLIQLAPSKTTHINMATAFFDEQKTMATSEYLVRCQQT